ncbi:uncharacterized protein ASCRUDRAFT_147691 [Ascoidea rubescens DSM 1968]|uniref:Uncharacterized protein n=1 Tax=Ascoidea rubescens DSM 1968 TaxID=1344418 RepID=A0A1D2VID6_9ASCO|nr:hypothetical protein ASCRUDRAFT_147691 [Ascoidea rubescens DSM 1968]ODV61227.1 hypothetical protein ASCRUDRAFT_147691 [Ascoidea rubescens DSM 1968]
MINIPKLYAIIYYSFCYHLFLFYFYFYFFANLILFYISNFTFTINHTCFIHKDIFFFFFFFFSFGNLNN